MTDEPGHSPTDDGAGMVRFEVTGRAADQDLVRTLAQRLAQDDAEGRRLRAVIAQEPREAAPDGPRPRGGILAALRRSPMVGADLDLTREVVPERDVDL